MRTPLALLLVTVGLAGVAPAADAEVLGHTLDAHVRLDGVGVPSGTTLIGATRLSTGVSPGAVHLQNGSTMLLASDTLASLTGPKSQPQLAVASGEVAWLSPNGTVTKHAAQDLGEGDKVDKSKSKSNSGGGGGGLSTATMIGIGAAAVAAAVIVIENNQDEASP